MSAHFSEFETCLSGSTDHLKRTNQTESSRGSCDLFIIQEMDATHSSVSIWGWREEEEEEEEEDGGMQGWVGL